MKYLFTTFLVLGFICSKADVAQMRNLFFAASNTEGIKEFYTQAQLVNESDNVLKAYKGVATAMYAGIASSVSEKLDYFSKGKALLEAAVTADWYNAEIRFLRFSVQSEVPFFVGYSDKLKDDSLIVLNALKAKSVDSSLEFWKKAIQFMINSDELSSDMESELKKMKV
jgi:hypothetical protein